MSRTPRPSDVDYSRVTARVSNAVWEEAQDLRPELSHNSLIAEALRTAIAVWREDEVDYVAIAKAELMLRARITHPTPEMFDGPVDGQMVFAFPPPRDDRHDEARQRAVDAARF
jgi:hypothetical protein